jgi:hypothetical protein
VTKLKPATSAAKRSPADKKNTTVEMNKKASECEAPSSALNTEKEGAKLLALLDNYNISRAFFAKKKLCISNVNFERLIVSPKTWARLNDQERKKFVSIHKWTSAKPGEWEELKQSFDRSKAH